MEDEERFKVVSKTEILVNLDAPPKLPFDDAEIEKNSGGGWVKVEKREDGLYVDEHKVTLYLSEQQVDGKVISGFKLREELLKKPVLHPNIPDALIEYPDLIPEDWINKNLYVYIFFWAVIFRCSGGRLDVRCLFSNSGQWYWDYFRLDNIWGDNSYAALLEISS